MPLPNQATPEEVRLFEGQAKTYSIGNCTTTPGWPSRIFEVLDRIDRNAAQVLRLLIGGVR